MTYPSPPPSWSPPAPPRRTWDLVLTIVLLVVLLLETPLVSYFGLFLAMMSDPCGGSASCDFGLMTAGFYTAVAGPWVLLVVVLIVAIVLLVRRRVAFWVPIVGIVLCPGLWILGATIGSAGLPR